MNFSDKLRDWFKDLLDSLSKIFNKLGITPNTMTLIGLFGNVIASIFIAKGQLLIGGFLVLIMGPLDALDGTMARLRRDVNAFGSFLDSIADRYSELFILGGLLVFFLQSMNTLGCLLVYLAASGSVLVSYARAKAESVGLKAKSGLLTRVERYLVIAPSLLIQQPLIGLWIIAIFGNLTSLQRIWEVHNQVQNLLKKGIKNAP